MSYKQIETSDYVVKVGKGFINADDKLIVSTDIGEICDESAFYYLDEAREKVKEFGGKLFEIVLIEREVPEDEEIFQSKN